MTHLRKREQRRGNAIVALACACTSMIALTVARPRELNAAVRAAALHTRASHSQLARDPAPLNRGQVLRGIDAALRTMRQRHESKQAARPAEPSASSRDRKRSTGPAPRRDPGELSVHPLPASE